MKRIAALTFIVLTAAACTTTEQRIGGAVGAIAAPSVTRSARRASRR